MELALDRLGILLDQLDSATGFARRRLHGLSDEESLWEPVAACWSVRPKGQAVSADAYGPGAWQLDAARVAVDPPPVTTIAWRLGHLTSGLAGRWEWTFGSRSVDPRELVDFAPDASGALASWELWLGRWRTGLDSLAPEQLDQVGYSQYPWGLDPGIAFVGVMWWTNQEVIHHMAEIALLRDLWPPGRAPRSVQ